MRNNRVFRNALRVQFEIYPLLDPDALDVRQVARTFAERQTIERVLKLRRFGKRLAEGNVLRRILLWFDLFRYLLGRKERSA